MKANSDKQERRDRTNPSQEERVLQGFTPPADAVYTYFWRTPHISSQGMGLVLILALFVNLISGLRARFLPVESVWVVTHEEVLIYRVRGSLKPMVGELALRCPLSQITVRRGRYLRGQDRYGIWVRLCNGATATFRGQTGSTRAESVVEALLSRSNSAN